jgi:hypothetical protein
MRFLFAAVLFAAPLGAAEWEPFVSPFNQIFPSVEIATATMESDGERNPTVIGDDMSLIGISMRSTRANQRVRVLVSLPALMADSSIDAVLPRAGVEYEIYPTLRWNYSALMAVRRARPETVTFEVSVDGAPVQTKVIRARLRNINDALYFVDPDPEKSDDDLDFNWMFAAYVNEDSALVDDILKEALDTELVESFDGYQSGDQAQVYAQVFAIWYALQQRGIRYSNITATSSTHQNVHSQNVRFIEQSWRNTQANCVDGSVLLASVLRKIDIAPVLVLVPGHMFLGFSLDEEGSEIAFLETTMMGSDDPGDVDRDMVRLARDMSDDESVQQSYLVFAAALDQGRQQVEEGGEKFDDPDEPDYQIIDVAAARELGVMPIIPDEPNER